MQWRDPPLTAVSIGMSLHSFLFKDNQTLLSFTVEVQPPYWSGITIIFTPNIVRSGTFFYYMTFNVIAVANQSNQLELIACQRNFAQINSGVVNWDLFNVSSSKFYFMNNDEVKVYGLLQWIKYSYVDSTENFQLQVYPLLNSNKLQIQWDTFLRFGQNMNIFDSFKVMVLVVNLYI